VRFGGTEVLCEGYEYPEDPYILAGSCGLEYKMELTAAGRADRRQASSSSFSSGAHYDSGGAHYDSAQYHSGGHGNDYHYDSNSSSGWGGVVLLLGIVGAVIFCCRGANGQSPSGGRAYYTEGVPPNGYDGGGGTSGNTHHTYNSQPHCNNPHYPTTGHGGAGGFLGGLAGGALLGQLFGGGMGGGYGRMGGYGMGGGMGYGGMRSGYGGNFGSAGGYGGGRAHTAAPAPAPRPQTRTATGFATTRRR
jgi:hypothetical protein